VKGKSVKTPPAAGKKAAASGVVASYVPGARPTLPGIYVPFESTPDVVVLQLEDLERPAPEAPDPWRGLRRVRIVLTVLLLGLSLGACQIDRSLNFDKGVFTMLTPFVWLGIVLVFAATRRPTPRPKWVASGVGCLGGGALLFILTFAVFIIQRAQPPGPLAWVIGTTVTLGAAWIFGASTAAGKGDAGKRRWRLELVRRVVHALADDVVAGKRVSGWLDLTGADQPSKLVREAKARSGAQVQLYRDEWWRLRLPLRDGNDLRVSGVDRVKARREHGKRNARGKYKTKPGRMEQLHTLEVRLAVNAAVYRIKPPETQALQLGQLTLPAPTLTGTVLSYVVPADAFTADEALGIVAAMYRQLEPLAQPLVGG
jgi:hypothetical protein